MIECERRPTPKNRACLRAYAAATLDGYSRKARPCYLEGNIPITSVAEIQTMISQREAINARFGDMMIRIGENAKRE